MPSFPMMDPILEPLRSQLKSQTESSPDSLYLNVTEPGLRQATDPSYWARHLRQTVQFTAGISQLLQEPNRSLLEVGPGHLGLCSSAC